MLFYTIENQLISSNRVIFLSSSIICQNKNIVLGYNQYREICRIGNGKAKTWNDFQDYIDDQDVRKLQQHYRHVDDVDLYVGGFLERKHRDSAIKVGPVFKCIIGDTFAR